jgi:hypothetical protein
MAVTDKDAEAAGVARKQLVSVDIDGISRAALRYREERT